MDSRDARARLIRRLRQRLREGEERASSRLSLLDRGREIATPWGRCCAIRFLLSELGVNPVHLVEVRRRWSPATPGLPAQPERLLGLDIETTGLSGEQHPLFLVGLARWRDDGLEVLQFFARSLEEEGAVIEAARQWIERYQGLVTFNGCSFDWPYLCHRWRHHRLPIPNLRQHVDVLRLARRYIGYRYGDCRLQTLEAKLFGRRRTDDIPSREIPQAYQRYLRTRETSEIERVLYHNALDLLTTTELLFHLHERLRGKK